MTKPIDTSWEYWRGKYGHIETLKEFYPEILETDVRLQQAVAQIENAYAAIDQRMQELIMEELAQQAQELDMGYDMTDIKEVEWK